MDTVPQEHEMCYYAHDAYAPVSLRFLATFIDWLCVLLLAVPALSLPFILDSPSLEPFLAILWFAIVWLYFVELKRSRWGTVGYRLCRLKVVDMQGHTPTRMQMGVRFAHSLFGWPNSAVDLFWVLSDDDRQAVRDKVAETYVVRKSAEPAGRGSPIHRRYMICGWHYVFREVHRPGQGA